MIGELTASSFPFALHDELHELVGRFDGDAVFPVIIVLRDHAEGYGVFRWLRYDAELETLATSTIQWPVFLTLISAGGEGTTLHIEERGWLQ